MSRPSPRSSLRHPAADATDRFNRIVVGADGSPQSLAAARYGAEAAALRGARLTLLYGYGPPPLTPLATGAAVASASADGVARAEDCAEAVVDRVIRQLEGRSAILCDRVVEVGAPSFLLRREARRASLVVLGHHHLHLGRHTLGLGLASPVAAHSPCPVVIVPESWPEDARGPVVVLVDLETGAHSALRLGFREASLRHTPLVALHVDRRNHRERADGIPELAALLTGKADHPDVEVRVSIQTGPVTDVVLGASHGASLLIVERPHDQHRGAWSGSLAHQILQRSGCPLAVVPQDASDGFDPRTGS